MGDNDERYDKLSKEFDEFRAMSGELEEQLELELKEKQETIKGLESECGALRQKRQNEIRKNNETLDKMQQAEKALSTKLDTAKNKLRMLEVEEESREKELRRVNNALVVSKQALEDLQEEHILLKGELLHAETERNSTKRTCEQLQRQLKEVTSPPSSRSTGKFTVSHNSATLLLDTLTDSKNLEVDLLKLEASVHKHLQLKLWERRRSV
eukprot:TRINITY_DN449_c11_g1_i1.p1 TRINITY_DN449_c11_g1~~TRINITY_DN449_c11_g1_i1.p1  ORF type:complete len:211 (+),score=51.48 TRINITY_DN449_c11_g1_i1:84-716(+)